MKTCLQILVLILTHALVLNAGDLSREVTYNSLEEFVAAASACRPSNTKGEFQKLLSIPEPGEIVSGTLRPDRIADSVQACETVWNGDQAALVFVTARPPTEATPSEIGLLIYLERTTTGWMINDVSRFTALGKYAKITAELTAVAGSTSSSFPPMVTIKEYQGGRGYSYELSASYTIDAHKIVRKELE